MAWEVVIDAIQARQLGQRWTDVVPPPPARAGEYHAIVAPCGSGKTAIAHALGAVGQGRTWQGAVRRTEGAIAGIVPAAPDLVFSGLAETLEEEIRLGCSRPPLVPLGEVIEALGLQPLLARNPFSFSGGQRALAAVAVMVGSGTPLLALDQAAEWLDVDNRRRLSALLSRWTALGGGVLELSARTLLSARPPLVLGHASSSSIELGAVAGVRVSASSGAPALRVSGVRFAYPSGGFCIGPVTFDVPRGSRLALVGPNGVGKTTILRCLAHLLVPSAGDIVVQDPGGSYTYEPRHHHRWARKVRMVLQNPDDQLYLPTVRAELGNGPAHQSVAVAFGLDAHLDRSPFDLPRPLRRLLTIATALAARPPVLLLDEPTAWLDEDQVVALALELGSYTEAGGTVVFISHDAPFVECVAGEELRISAGGRCEIYDLGGNRKLSAIEAVVDSLNQSRSSLIDA